MIFSLLFSSIFSILDFFAQSSTLSLFERDTKKPKVFLLCSTVLLQNDDAQRAHHDHSSSVFCSSRPLEKTIYTKILLLLLLLLSFFLCFLFFFFFFLFFASKKKGKTFKKETRNSYTRFFLTTLNFPLTERLFLQILLLLLLCLLVLVLVLVLLSSRSIFREKTTTAKDVRRVRV